MDSPRKTSLISNISPEKRTSQWEDLMRKFSAAHKDVCTYGPLEIPRAKRSTKFFPTGSHYEGQWDILGMSGHGEYTFPNGVIYEGEFEEGMFHGKGCLRYEDITVNGKWVRGVLTERSLVFGDNLQHDEPDWKYCMYPDRRFAKEYVNGIKPAGESYLTADQPTKEIYPGMYDTGDGMFDPKTNIIYMYGDLKEIIRIPVPGEREWIMRHCRMNEIEPLGPCSDLYEKFSQPLMKLLPSRPPPSGAKRKVKPFMKPAYEPTFEVSAGSFYDFRHSASESSSNSDN